MPIWLQMVWGRTSIQRRQRRLERHDVQRPAARSISSPERARQVCRIHACLRQHTRQLLRSCSAVG